MLNLLKINTIKKKIKFTEIYFYFDIINNINKIYNKNYIKNNKIKNKFLFYLKNINYNVNIIKKNFYINWKNKYFIYLKNKSNFLYNNLYKGLIKTRNNFKYGLFKIFKNKTIIDNNIIYKIETQLLMADIGIETTTKIISIIKKKIIKNNIYNVKDIYIILKNELNLILKSVEKPLNLENLIFKKPFLIIIVGVNGVGKTTTIGKLTKYYKNLGKSVLLAAGDTYRVAAIEQIQILGENNNVPVILKNLGADSAYVIYEALMAARFNNIDILIADTAGRLQNNKILMDELKKIYNLLNKIDRNIPNEIMLILDASIGQNAIYQTSIFNNAVPINGITLTKLDGTSKGGVIFSIANKFNIPIRFISLGESINDLYVFKSKNFIETIF
ncbi:Signal recognition particle receptor FtsY [Candidatus Johnevansia muelleri]|uniref:Signal recognition particle receptor FtsY n=1 Tax=Candidatus Johnevansia muelleri TaxID=1495769 RepID=A0A078KI30_9GAMM|nr:Signal recognition particle receptor FtsY [Candidatus Evansia muelleri]